MMGGTGPVQTFAARGVSACGFVVEPADLWARRIDRIYLAKAPRFAGGRFMAPSPAMIEMPTTAPPWIADDAASGDPWKRAAALEAAGVQAQILYPAYSWSLYGLQDSGLQAACFQAYNSFLYSLMFACPVRFRGVALVAQSAEGLIEFERCAALGYPSAIVPAVLDGPFAERLWAKAAELGLPVTLGFPGVDPAFTPDEYAERSWAFVSRMADARLFDRLPALRLVILGAPPAGLEPAIVARVASWREPTSVAVTGAERASILDFYGLDLPERVSEADVYAGVRQFYERGRKGTDRFSKPRRPTAVPA